MGVHGPEPWRPPGYRALRRRRCGEHQNLIFVGGNEHGLQPSQVAIGTASLWPVQWQRASGSAVAAELLFKSIEQSKRIVR